MTPISEFLKAISALLWPLIVIGVVWALLPSIQMIIAERGFVLEIGTFKVSVQEATDQIREQIRDLQKQVISLREETSTKTISAGLQDAPQRLKGNILWVDDNPRNNAIQIAQLQKLGATVTTVRSTQSAIDALGASEKYDLIISDMGRDESGKFDEKAGLKLLKDIRGRRIQTPFIVYTRQDNFTENNRDVRGAGGEGVTSSAVQLLEWVDRIFDTRKK